MGSHKIKLILLFISLIASSDMYSMVKLLEKIYKCSMCHLVCSSALLNPEPLNWELPFECLPLAKKSMLRNYTIASSFSQQMLQTCTYIHFLASVNADVSLTAGSLLFSVITAFSLICTQLLTFGKTFIYVVLSSVV